MIKVDKRKLVNILFLSILLLMSLIVCANAQDKVVFNYGIDQELSSPDPALSQSGTDAVILVNLYEFLVFPSKAPGKVVEPMIAKSWDISEDGKTYTFYLREGVKFHDGSEVTAEDVVFSLDRTMNLNYRMATFLKGPIAAGIAEAIDKYTVIFHLVKSDPSFLVRLPKLAIVNKDLLLENIEEGEYGEFGDYGTAYLETHDAGSGPYKLGTCKYAELITFEKFDDYWKGWEKGSIDEARVHIIPEQVTRTTLLKMGNLDMVDSTMDPLTYFNLKKEPGIVVHQEMDDNVWMAIMNNTNPPLDDINVRKAIAYAVDYATISNTILYGKQAIGPLPINLFSHSNDVTVYNKNIEKAKDLLQKSKYSAEELSNFQLVWKAPTPEARGHMIALCIQASLQEIGLNVNIENISWTDNCFLCGDSENNSQVHFTCFYQPATYEDPAVYFVFYTEDYWDTPYPPGIMHYHNPEVTELIQKFGSTIDTEERLEISGKVQKLITEDCPLLLLANSGHFAAYYDYVKGYKFPVGAAFYDIKFSNFKIEK